MGFRAPVPVLSRWLAVLIILSILLIGLSVLVPIPAVAQSGSYGFASAVPCLNGDLSLATTCFADTMYKPVAADDPALVRVTISSTKQMLAPIGTTSGGYRQRMASNSGIGSVYGLAYDDGVFVVYSQAHLPAASPVLAHSVPAVCMNIVSTTDNGGHRLPCLTPVQIVCPMIQTIRQFLMRWVKLVLETWRSAPMARRSTSLTCTLAS